MSARLLGVGVRSIGMSAVSVSGVSSFSVPCGWWWWTIVTSHRIAVVPLIVIVVIIVLVLMLAFVVVIIIVVCCRDCSCTCTIVGPLIVILLLQL